MNEHQHAFVFIQWGNYSELICECGTTVRSLYNGAICVEDEPDIEGRGTE